MFLDDPKRGFILSQKSSIWANVPLEVTSMLEPGRKYVRNLYQMWNCPLSSAPLYGGCIGSCIGKTPVWVGSGGHFYNKCGPNGHIVYHELASVGKKQFKNAKACRQVCPKLIDWIQINISNWSIDWLLLNFIFKKRWMDCFYFVFDY